MSRGFSLVEALLATMVMSVALVAVAHLAVLAARATERAGSGTLMAVLAAQKLEQFRALAWTFDASGTALSDTSTDTASGGAPFGAGTGLTPSPPGALAQNTDGYCDFLDEYGRSLGGGTMPPARTAFVRRWSTHTIDGSLNDTLVIMVVVARQGGGVDDVRMTGVRTRKGG